MTRYLISFEDGAMDFAEEDLPAVVEAVRTLVAEAEAAGVWVFGGGVNGHEASVVDTDGTVTKLSYPPSTEHLGGFAVVDVDSREEALEWGHRLAVACRCEQEVRELLPDPPY